MPRRTIALVAALALWIFWGILVIEEIVPRLRQHITMWPWFLAYALCLLPVIMTALVLVIRINRGPK